MSYRTICLAALALASLPATLAAQPVQPPAAATPLVGATADQGLAPAQPGSGNTASAATATPPSAATVDSGAETIEAAIAAGDIRRLMELGGRPTDVIAAMR